MDGFKPTGLVRPCHRSTKGADVSTLELRRQLNSSVGNPALSSTDDRSGTLGSRSACSKMEAGFECKQGNVRL
jgi:hypothetical protein